MKNPRKVFCKKEGWNDRRIHKTKELIMRGYSISQIGRYFNTSRQCLHAALKNRYTDLYEQYKDYKDHRYSKTLKFERDSRVSLFKYQMSYADVQKLSIEDKKLQARKVTIWRNKLSQTKLLNKVFDIDFGEIYWPEYCPVLSVKLDYVHDKKKGRAFSPSFDRVDNTKGYVKGNVRIISFRANWFKSSILLPEAIKLLDYMIKQSGTKKFWFSPERVKARRLMRIGQKICHRNERTCNVE